MEYEGIYRKTGGAGQCKIITQLFERGDYNAFDLCDSDRFNDICAVTSVLKNYFRSLPDPLLTSELHERFMSAAHVRDPAAKTKAMQDLVVELPSEHYHTVKLLMSHLHRYVLSAHDGCACAHGHAASPSAARSTSWARATSASSSGPLCSGRATRQKSSATWPARRSPSSGSSSRLLPSSTHDPSTPSVWRTGV
jgi:hypothetical protein